MNTPILIHYNNITWNLYRYVGDGLRIVAVAMLVGRSCCTQTVAGLSRKTQLLYLLFCISRYLDLFEHSQYAYLVVCKIFFITGHFVIWLSFCMFHNTYDREKDTCPISIIILPCFVAACALTETSSVVETMWTFSQFLEGFAMVPQYIFSYRDRAEKRPSVTAFVVCMGTYRACYILNWMYKKAHMKYYFDVHSWLGGAVNLSFYLDYMLYQFAGSSLLKRLTLGVDDGINRASEELASRLGVWLLVEPNQAQVRGSIAELRPPHSQYGPVTGLPTQIGAETNGTELS
mmetsp:Transcript_89500/g.208439  ORF Transcript_89500/g.208439 Transcript_89500/m.208439 type:complete len:289 (-) Transcript_89500:61-927(-)|eukprot:CAMPEP_0171110082 /NCGR_PEP_ID=MMETSP0766_2-20121228/71153_1 /TAXON_ID=439317 /ORGANISM="Gambierdiscus australes, Strain CAWD 149" /LENGTH=288 /DNA_ID=CAMNT_0011571913 /DNA_START=40 /DNA_END=906 /DNA_ORIENTATION=+